MSVADDRAHRLPPQNLEAERGVIGSVLLDNPLLDDLAEFLAAEDFYRDAHRILYRTMADLRDAGKPVDGVTVCEMLERRDQLRAVGGEEYLAEIVADVPHPAHGVYYGRIVREKAVGRRLMEAAAAILDDGYGNAHTADELIARAEERVFAVGEREAVGQTRPVGDLAAEALGRLGRRNDGEYCGVATGFADFDNTTDGLANGQLAILAARPSMGKTALALQVAERAAVHAGIPTLFVSLEMGGIELAERLLVSLSGVDGHRVRTGQDLGPRDHQALGDACGRLRRAPGLWIDESPLRSAGQIAANARRHKARHGIGLLVVDYLQLIASGPEVAPRASRQEQVAAISRRLKTLAKELDLPVLCLSQLNRQSEQREDRRPRLADLRESGAIEQDADLVLLLHRPEFYDPNDSPGLAELIIAKNRNGATGSLRLRFARHLARFEDVDSSASINPGDF